MRGKREDRERRERKAGITPAHAGKTERLLPYRRRAKDHPRACGENLVASVFVLVV